MTSGICEDSLNMRHKEKKRTECINNAFAELRKCIPNVPSDTKLSKIKTLRLASSYISFLSELLENADTNCGKEFNAEIQVLRSRDRHVNNRWEISNNPRTDMDVAEISKKRELASKRHSNRSGDSGKRKGRTGWPEAVWAEALESLERTKNTDESDNEEKFSNGISSYNNDSWSYGLENSQFQLGYYRYIPQTSDQQNTIPYQNAVTSLTDNAAIQPTAMPTHSIPFVYASSSQGSETKLLNIVESALPLNATQPPGDMTEGRTPVYMSMTSTLPSISTLSYGDKFQEGNSKTSDMGPNLIELQPVSLSSNATSLTQ